MKKLNNPREIFCIWTTSIVAIPINQQINQSILFIISKIGMANIFLWHWKQLWYIYLFSQRWRRKRHVATPSPVFQKEMSPIETWTIKPLGHRLLNPCTLCIMGPTLIHLCMRFYKINSVCRVKKKAFSNMIFYYCLERGSVYLGWCWWGSATWGGVLALYQDKTACHCNCTVSVIQLYTA